jgi:uncharacterized iron-regulated membrane protein
MPWHILETCLRDKMTQLAFTTWLHKKSNKSCTLRSHKNLGVICGKILLFLKIYFFRNILN